MLFLNCQWKKLLYFLNKKFHLLLYWPCSQQISLMNLDFQMKWQIQQTDECPPPSNVALFRLNIPVEWSVNVISEWKQWMAPPTLVALFSINVTLQLSLNKMVEWMEYKAPPRTAVLSWKLAQQFSLKMVVEFTLAILLPLLPFNNIFPLIKMAWNIIKIDLPLLLRNTELSKKTVHNYGDLN